MRCCPILDLVTLFFFRSHVNLGHGDASRRSDLGSALQAAARTGDQAPADRGRRHDLRPAPGRPPDDVRLGLEEEAAATGAQLPASSSR